jgi:hypothetical protein
MDNPIDKLKNDFNINLIWLDDTPYEYMKNDVNFINFLFKLNFISKEHMIIYLDIIFNNNEYSNTKLFIESYIKTIDLFKEQIYINTMLGLYDNIDTIKLELKDTIEFKDKTDFMIDVIMQRIIQIDNELKTLLIGCSINIEVIKEVVSLIHNYIINNKIYSINNLFEINCITYIIYDVDLDKLCSSNTSTEAAVNLTLFSSVLLHIQNRYYNKLIKE